MHKEYQELPEKGLLNLIQQKLEAGGDLVHIEAMLVRAGLEEGVVRKAMRYVIDRDTSRHQREAALNDFLPPLKKIRVDTVVAGAAGSLAKVIGAEIGHKGLFSGRLRRKDFIIGILFFFGLGFILANMVTSWVQFFAPDFANAVIRFVLADTYGIWLMLVPFAFAPITLMILSLMTRRLHNIGLPGWISILYLIAFISPFGALGGYVLLGFHFMLLVLFVVMVTVKGHPSPNKHGSLPPSTGSIFGKVFGE